MTLSIQEQFGQIDIYLFDQILRGNIVAGMRVLDAGCGYGRNLVYLLRAGCEVFAIDSNAQAVAHVRELSRALETGLSEDHFRVGQIEELPFPREFADVVISNAVLHFARDQRQFTAMFEEMWRVLKPGGLLFCRLASRIGMEFAQVREGIFLLPDGSEWFLVNEEMLLKLSAEKDAVQADPLKTTIVENRRAMTTWVIRKRLA